MKKITFILLALLSGTAFGQSTVSSSAEIIQAISFSENKGLNFGKVDNGAGTVIIGTNGSTNGGTKTKQIAGGAPGPADLTVKGEPDEAYNIIVNPLTTLSGSGSSMDVIDINHNGTGILDAAGEEIFQIGGTLKVNAGQATGTYTGTVSVTVSYN